MSQDLFNQINISSWEGQSSQGVPRIIAVEAISFAKVLKFFSISSSFDRRVRRESWMLERIQYMPKERGLGID